MGIHEVKESLVRWQQSISHVLSTVPRLENVWDDQLKVTPHPKGHSPPSKAWVCLGVMLPSIPTGLILGVGPWWSSAQTSKHWLRVLNLQAVQSDVLGDYGLSVSDDWWGNMVQLILRNVFKVAWTSPWIVKKYGLNGIQWENHIWHPLGNHGLERDETTYDWDH